GFVADVDDYFGGRNFENRPLDDLTFRDIPEAVIVGIEQARVLFGVNLLVVFARPGFEALIFVFAVFAFRAINRSGAAAAAGTGGILVFYVRHALRVLHVSR